MANPTNQLSQEMLTAMMTDPRATPQQRLAAMNGLKVASGEMPQMVGDSTGIGSISPLFLQAIRQEMSNEDDGGNDPSEDIMQGANDANMVAKKFAEGGRVNRPLFPDYGAPATRVANYEKIGNWLYDYVRRSQAEAERRRGLIRENRTPTTSNLSAALNQDQSPVPYNLVSPEWYEQRQYPPPQEPQPEMPSEQDWAYIYGMNDKRAMPPANSVLPPITEPKVEPPPPAVSKETAEEIDQAAKDRRVSEEAAYRDRMQKLLADDEPLSSQDKWMAVMRAGLGMTAAASKPGATFLGSFGEGGLNAINSVEEARSNRAVQQMRKAALLQSQYQAGVEAEQRNRELGIRSRMADYEGQELERKSDPNTPENKLREAQAAYYKAYAKFREDGGAASDKIAQRVIKLREIYPDADETDLYRLALGKTAADQITRKEALEIAARMIQPTIMPDDTTETIQARLDNLVASLMKEESDTNSQSPPPPNPDRYAGFFAKVKPQ